MVLYDLRSGTERVFLDAASAYHPPKESPPRLDLAWSSDGKRLIIAEPAGGRTLQLDPDSGIISASEDRVAITRQVDWVSGQTAWAWRTGPRWEPIRIRNPKGEEREWGRGFVVAWLPDGRLLLIRWGNAHLRLQLPSPP